MLYMYVYIHAVTTALYIYIYIYTSNARACPAHPRAGGCWQSTAKEESSPPAHAGIFNSYIAHPAVTTALSATRSLLHPMSASNI